jgi:hypothetical protein
MDDLAAILVHLLWIVPLLLAIALLSSPRWKGDIAQRRVRRILSANLQKNLYTVLNNLQLPTGGGTIRIDHVVVSRFGIFVIESQYARGVVSGTEVQERWKQRRFGRAVLFNNPLHRARLGVEALQRQLDYPASRFHPVVAFVGQSAFKKKMPPNVVPAEKLVPFIRMKSVHLLSAEQADSALRQITEGSIEPAGGLVVSPRIVLQFVLAIALLGGAYLAFRERVEVSIERLRYQSEVRSSPDRFRSDGTPKTERELWEDSLACAWSPDTGRCACYEPGGERATLDDARCRELAERGSVLRQ